MALAPAATDALEEVFIRDSRGEENPRSSRMKTSSRASVAAGARAINAPGHTSLLELPTPLKWASLGLFLQNRGKTSLESTCR